MKKQNTTQKKQTAEKEKPAGKRKKLILLLSIIIAVCLCAAIVITVVALTAKKSDDSGDTDGVFVNAYAATTKVGYQAEYLGTVERNIPTEYKDGGLVASGQIPAYPTYGTTLNLTTEQKQLLIEEANSLCGSGITNVTGTYDKMDKDGYLYLTDGTPVLDADGNHRQLYKHTASQSMYYGDGISDDEPRIIKRVTLSPRGYNSYSVTGVYAPAGEVIKIEVSKEDMDATGGFIVRIGQGLYNGKTNNIWSAKSIVRMPVISNGMKINADTATLENGVYTAYVGSYLGGPIYIHNTTADVTVTISGGVKYSHFILGYTTKEEFEDNASSSAPYFDLEVRNYGVLHSGPKTYAEAFSYDEIYDAAVLWEKISLVSTQGSSQGIVFMYDPFVAAGAAVAFPTQMSVNCPSSWMANSLNAKSFVESGAWGNMHEYNHNFQYYGVGNGGEVTNNGMNLVEYSLFTRISASRNLDNYGAGSLSGWNPYTTATWSLDQITSGKLSNGSSGLALYATLLHNFGQDNYIQAKVTQQSTSEFTESYTGYLGAWTQVTHNNMTYYFNELLGADVSEEFISQYTESSYPMFVPVSSVYQTGRSYTYDGEKKYIQTMQPYKINYGEDFTIDLSQYTTSEGVNSKDGGMYVSGSVVLPDGFSYTVKKVTQPENGSIKKVSDYVYTFKPNSEVKSGKIYVTLSIKRDDGSFKVDDVDLVLEFEQSHEMTKNTLERTVYSFTDNLYDSTTNTFVKTAADLYESDFAGYASVETTDNSNPKNANGAVIQNCNTDVWYVDALQDDANNTNDGVVDSSVKSQAIVLSGKLYADDAGKYRISLRGRMNVALFVSTDGKNYEKAVDYTSTNSGNVNFPTDVENGYMDIELEDGSWLYFKAVLVRYYGEPRGAFMGVGWGKWTEEQGTPVYDSNGNPVYNDDGSLKMEDYVAASVNVTYATGYRSSYEALSSTFESDYFYTRKYSYSYSDITTYNVGQQLVTENCKFSEGWGHALANLVDGNSKTYMHTSNAPSASNPVVIEAKLDNEITANRLIFDGSHNSESSFLPKDFKVWVSSDGENWQLACDVTGSVLSGNNWQVVAEFDKSYTFSYYKTEITATHKQYIALRQIIFQNYVIEIEDGEQISPDNSMFTYKGDWQTKSVYSSFGHVYTGKKDATLEFEFEGTRLGILSADGLGDNFKVEIDGVEVSSIQLKDPDGIYASFISQELKEGKHKVKITCLGDANIDSIVYW